MKLIKSALLGTTAALATVAVAQAADLPSVKSAPVEYVRVCDVYGAGFFYIPGTQTCLKVGGYVRVDYDYRPARQHVNGIAGAAGLNPVAVTPETQYGATAADRATNLTRSGFYNRAAVSLDARTQTAWGTVQTFMRLRMETGNGFLNRTNGATQFDQNGAQRTSGSATGASLEAAYIRFAGFTFGQAAHPFAFMSPWAYNTHYWTGWPNGVRQIAYTATFGGGFSATAALTDSANYASVTSGIVSPQNLTNNGIVAVGALRLDQAWGSAQVMGAVQKGGNLAGGNTPVQVVSPNSGNDRTGYAIGAGLAVNLPMIASGDRFEITAVYGSRLLDLVGNSNINTPSAPAYGSNPLGGPNYGFQAGKGWQVGAQFRHYWTPELRSQVYASYISLQSDCKQTPAPAIENGCTPNGFFAPVLANGQNVAQQGLAGTARGKAFSLGHALIWSPTAGFDIGLEVTYLRSNWNAIAVNNSTGYAPTTTVTGTAPNQVATTTPGLRISRTEDNFVGKLRVQRDF